MRGARRRRPTAVVVAGRALVTEPRGLWEVEMARCKPAVGATAAVGDGARRRQGPWRLWEVVAVARASAVGTMAPVVGGGGGARAGGRDLGARGRWWWWDGAYKRPRVTEYYFVTSNEITLS